MTKSLRESSSITICLVWQYQLTGFALIELSHSPMTLYAMSPLIGSVLGPIISGYCFFGWSTCVPSDSYNLIFQIYQSTSSLEMDLSYHNHLVCSPTALDCIRTYSLLFSLSESFTLTCLDCVKFIPETYAPILIARKAARIRKQTGDTRFYAPLERKNANVTLLESTKLGFYRPFRASSLFLIYSSTKRQRYPMPQSSCTTNRWYFSSTCGWRSSRAPSSLRSQHSRSSSKQKVSISRV